MLKKMILGLFVIVASGTSYAQQAGKAPDADGVYAWYREDGIQLRGDKIAAWNSAGATVGGAGGARALSQVVGAPRVVRVKAASGEKNVVSFDGSAALWQKKESWKEIGGDVTVVALLRLRSLENGFLFDGSTGSGLTRAQVRDKQWQIGVQPSAASATSVAGNADISTLAAQNNAWQTHAFVFRKTEGSATHSFGGATKTVTLKASSPLTGFIVGANGAAKNGLRVDVAELLVFDRALSGDELANVSKYLSDKWGTPETIGGDNVAQADKAAIAQKLADKSKPMIWVWSGTKASQAAPKIVRSEPQNFAERVRWELGRRRDIVIDTRTSKNTAGALSKNFEARIARFRPAVVVLEPAPGDDAGALVTQVRKAGAIPILQGDAANLAKTANEEGVILVETKPGANALSETIALLGALGIDDPNSSLQKQAAG